VSGRKGVLERSPACARANIILAFAREPVTGVDDLHRLLTEERAGVPAPLVVLRRGMRRQLVIVPAPIA
jgi:S1-C subfamily serine protease